MNTTITLDDLTEPAPPEGPADWNETGVVSLPGFYFTLERERLIRRYRRVWIMQHGLMPDDYGPPWRDPGGWPDPIPYMRHPDILNLVDPLAPILADLIGEPAGLHLNLTGWVTTERDWHQDSYLNPPHVGDRYVALWLALDDIDPDSGPFQYVPGSHRWPQVTRQRIWDALGTWDPQRWPKESERILTPLFEAEIARREAIVVDHLPRQGDVLLWHGRLLHRGSRAAVPGTPRPAFIAHFSGITARPDMPTPVQHDQGWYFPIEAS